MSYGEQECGCEECTTCLGREVRSLEKALRVMTEARAADAEALRARATAAEARVSELRGLLERACSLADGLGELVHDEYCSSEGPRFEACYDEDAECGETRATIANLRARGFPLKTEGDGGTPTTETKGQPCSTE